MSYEDVWHGIWKLEMHIFWQNNFGQRGVNTCWPLSVFVSIRAYFYVYFCTKAQIQHLGNTCWPSVDQIFFIKKYDISAFKCRVHRPHIAFIHEYLIWWNFSIFMHFLRSQKIWRFFEKWKMAKFATLGNTCGLHV